MKGKHSCELLDEDRFAAPDDLKEEIGYEYYEMDRKYEKMVRYYDSTDQYDDNLSYKEGLSTLSKPLTGVENTHSSCIIPAVVSNSATP